MGALDGDAPITAKSCNNTNEGILQNHFLEKLRGDFFFSRHDLLCLSFVDELLRGEQVLLSELCVFGGQQAQRLDASSNSSGVDLSSE